MKFSYIGVPLLGICYGIASLWLPTNWWGGELWGQSHEGEFGAMRRLSYMPNISMIREGLKDGEPWRGKIVSP